MPSNFKCKQAAQLRALQRHNKVMFVKSHFKCFDIPKCEIETPDSLMNTDCPQLRNVMHGPKHEQSKLKI